MSRSRRHPRSNSNPSPNLQPVGTPRYRYRVRFAKTGLLRWISHRDLANLWERIGRRAELPFSMTEGFNPKPRMQFPSALSLGVESLDEVLDLELREDWPAEKLLERLQLDDQPGLTINSVSRVDLADGKSQLAAMNYAVTLPDDFDDEESARVEQAINRIKQEETVSIERKGKTVTAHVATQLPLLDLQTDKLVVRIVTGDGASLKIQDILDLLGLSDWPERGATLVRTGMDLKGELKHS
ncbi:TIGR03936 family radical SAM-associated protein [Aporhodopirellula aestuarii]|uniref:TIGR03936 family radical SAM-associated protein n=1 Tax=Aporhodopirellula aestuarii TaxID=2950107 RepID=A0ABT0U3D4_9BACT|nr:TIGR03936 family radical SAM-associated protein [Aporhodopirellula aestuarii]MCM2371316.1 TIGR03936 family radical SAM-associated protein [Aporhodopirellula aestuarii]